jgi:hypothetical protein
MVESTRKQDGVVIEDGCSQIGDASIKPSRQGRESVAREAENLGTLERVAGAVDTAGDQRLTVRKHRGGVTAARGVEIAGKRPYAGRLRR